MQELLVVVTEALAEHHAADHVGHGAAQQEYWVKRLAWRRRGKHSRNPLLKNTNEKKNKSDIGKVRKSREDMFLPAQRKIFKLLQLTFNNLL